MVSFGMLLGLGPLEEGMSCKHWSKNSQLNMTTRGVRGSPHFSRHSSSKSCLGNFLILHEHDCRWWE